MISIRIELMLIKCHSPYNCRVVTSATSEREDLVPWSAKLLIGFLYGISNNRMALLHSRYSITVSIQCVISGIKAIGYKILVPYKLYELITVVLQV